MLNTALSPPPHNKQSGNPKPIKTPSFRPAMEIASCSRQLSTNPGIRTLPTCSSDITRASSLPVSCRCNPRGCSPVYPFRRISPSQTRIRMSNHSHRFTSDAWLGSFQPRCLLHCALGDATVETSDCAGEFSSNVLGSKDAVPQEKGHEETDGETDLKYLADNRMIKICNKLIEVFMVDKPTTTDWRRLLAFSKEWENIRPHFFRHCQERADAENNPEMKQKLLKLGRRLKEIDDDVQRHNELINAIKVEPAEISSIVAKRRKDFTKEFFVHLHTVAESYFENPTERTVLAKLGNDCLATVQAYDSASESIQAVEAAELKLQDIINSPSVDVACRKIDALAEKKQLDSALMLMLTKAWSAAKESNMMKDEVKDILYHLYNTAVGNMQRLVPKEIRILKYLLTIEDPEEQLSSLKDAFTPGAEMEGKDVDCLYTTPEQLHTWIRTVVDAYNFSREGTLLREARDLMNPNVIQKLEHLKKLVQDHFL